MRTFINSTRSGATECNNTLGQKYPRTELTHTSVTRERILLESAALFAKNGYHDVAVKDIANVVGIKPASIYNHFVSKESIWEYVLERIYDIYTLYYKRLDEALSTAKSFSDVLEILLYEPSQDLQPFIARGIALVQSEQFHSDRAAEIYNDVFVDYATDYAQRCFEECVEQGLASPFDTRTTAMMFTNTVTTLCVMRIHEYEGSRTPYDVDIAFESLRQYILSCAGIKSSNAAV